MKFKRFITLVLMFVLMSSLCIVNPVSGETLDKEQYYADSMARYEGIADLSDPQYISDEDFFGVWDGNQWIKTPYFYYEGYPAMSKVEEAAKKGDYDTCKAEILAYYRERYDNFNINLNVSKNVDYRSLIRYEACFENFVLGYEHDIVTRITFDETDSWQTANILYDVREAAQSISGKKPRYQLVASAKDGYMAEISTKESGYAPYIRVLVNDSYRDYPAIADTYISQLPDSSIAHGAEETMLVEESVSSINHYARRDEYRKLSFLQFDFSDLKPDDKISEATLYLHGKMTVSDCPEGIRVPSATKNVYLLNYIKGALTLDEQNFNYDKCQEDKGTSNYTSFDGLMSPMYTRNPDTGKISGNYMIQMEPYIQRPTLAYAATGNEVFAWHAIRTMMGIIRDRGDYETFYAIDHDEENSINAIFYLGLMGSSVPPMINRIIDSEHFTPEVMTTFLKYIYDSAKLIIYGWGESEEYNNFGIYGNIGLGVMGMYYPEFRAAHDPIMGIKDDSLPGSVYGGWIEVYKYRSAYKAKDDIREDGSSIEVSHGYATNNLHNLLDPIATAKETGVDAASYFSEDMIELMEKNAMHLMGHTNPLFGDWQYGDGAVYSENKPNKIKNILKLVDNPYIEYFTSGRKSGKQPEFLTCISDLAGKVTFRNSWEQEAVAGHLEASSGMDSHGHTDDLSLTVGAYGNYLLVDPLMGLYETKEPYESWISSTRGHNTVEINNTIARGGKHYEAQAGSNRKIIDGVLQGPDVFGEWMKYPYNVDRENGGGLASKISDLYPENRELNTIYDYVRGETFGYVNNNAMDSDYQVIRDTLFMHKGYFIVTDYIKPEDMEESNSYKQLWHFLPNANISVDTSADTVSTNFDGKANIIIANADSENETEPVIKDGLYADGKSNFVDAKYAYYEKTNTGITTYNTLLYPLAIGKNANVYVSNLPLDVTNDKANAFEAQIENPENNSMTSVYYYNLFDESLQKERLFGGYSTDAALALVEETDGKYSAAVLRKGNLIEDKLREGYLLYSTEKIQDLGVEWKDSVISLATAHTEDDNPLDLTKLTISSNNEVTAVTLNGENISFKQKGKYVYFGNNPILVDETKDDDSSEESDKSNHGVNGSIGSIGGSSGNKGNSGGNSSGGNKGSGGSSTGGSTVIGNAGGNSLNNMQNTFNDISNHWAFDYIVKAEKNGIVKGDENGNFNPEKTVTRAELIAMAMRTLKSENVTYDRSFTDVETDDWYSGAVAQALSLGIVSPDVWFRPNDPVTREEMCKILVGVAEKLGLMLPEETEQIVFADNDDISPWAKIYIDKATKLGLMQGMEDNSFRGKYTASRAQAITVIQRALEKAVSINEK